jgi:hypothetical protein
MPTNWTNLYLNIEEEADRKGQPLFVEWGFVVRQSASERTPVNPFATVVLFVSFRIIKLSWAVTGPARLVLAQHLTY